MFSLLDFGRMINDSVRMRAYHEALRRSVHSDSVVLDIGTGTGIFALLACQLGARRVYALDPSPWIEVGKKIAAANGFGDRIVFIRDVSTHVTLPEQADILVSELRGRQPLVSANLSSVKDARQRLLKPGAVIIPQRDIVYVSLIAAPDLYRKNLVTPWVENEYQLDMRAALSYARNASQRIRAADLPKETRPLFPPQVWVDFDYRTREDPNAQVKIEWAARSAATAHYVMLWFDTYLFEEVGFSTSPWKEHASIYSYDLLILQEPLEIATGDQVTLELSADLVQGEYIYSWNTTVHNEQGKLKAAFRQSTFFGDLLPPLRKPT